MRTVHVTRPDHDDTIRLLLGVPAYGDADAPIRRSNECGTGVFVRALWLGRKHVVILTYSQWQRRDGTATGDVYRLCCADDLPFIARHFGDDAEEAAARVLRVRSENVHGEAVSA